jgi:DNA-binding LacI/PurR family transcriptional regulator
LTGLEKELPSLLIAGNDLLATGAIRALKEYGLRIPEDVSIIGFDNMPLAAVMDPPLTTIDINSNGIYPFAIESLLDKIQNAAAGNCRRDVRGHLVERGSVKTIGSLL